MDKVLAVSVETWKRVAQGREGLKGSTRADPAQVSSRVGTQNLSERETKACTVLWFWDVARVTDLRSRGWDQMRTAMECSVCLLLKSLFVFSCP